VAKDARFCREEKSMRFRTHFFILIAALAFLLSGCAAKIYGTIELVDQNMKPIEGESPKGTVVQMINTSAKLEKASFAAIADEKGKFDSEKDALTPGKYKVEANRIGYETETETVEIKGSTRKKFTFKLKKIDEGKRKSIESLSSDADKIINPGEVNIQPPEL
jgi:PBP1b-binding outer membrane lipoprotein LpoB